MTTYRIYHRTTWPLAEDGSATLDALVLLGEEDGGSPQAAIRAWFKAASPSQSDAIEDETLVAIPASNHHELKLAVERQTRLVLS